MTLIKLKLKAIKFVLLKLIVIAFIQGCIVYALSMCNVCFVIFVLQANMNI